MLNMGSIAVCTKTQRYNCGALKLRKGAIVKLAEDPDDDGDVRIWRCADSHYHDIFYVSARGLRLASPEEQLMFNEGVRTLQEEAA
jgi:hypothetical protein